MRATLFDSHHEGKVMKVKITLELDEQFLKDVLTTICESGNYGINYWATPGRVVEGTPTDYTAVQIAYDREEGSEGDRKGRIKMNLKRVAEGIQRVLTTSPKELYLHESYIGRIAAAVAANDAGQIDGELADWIAQAAIFKKMVYS